MAAGNDVAGGWREAGGHFAQRGGKAIVGAVADENRQGGRGVLQPTPDAEFGVSELFA